MDHKKLAVGNDDFKETQKLVMKKADFEMTNELALAIKNFLSNHPFSTQTQKRSKQDSIELNPKPLANAPKNKLLIFLMLLKFEILMMF